MIRIVIENIVLFLLPTLIYVIFAAATRGSSKKGVFEDAPVVILMLLGTALVLIVLAFFGSDTRGKPGQVYVPPSFKDGQIEPGRLD